MLNKTLAKEGGKQGDHEKKAKCKEDGWEDPTRR